MLAVDIDQPVTQGAQLHQSRVIAIDESLATPIDMQDASNNAFPGGTHFVVSQPAVGLVRVIQVETNTYLGPFAAAANAVALGAVASHQLDRIEQDRFAGTSLAGKCAQARIEFKL